MVKSKRDIFLDLINCYIDNDKYGEMMYWLGRNIICLKLRDNLFDIGQCWFSTEIRKHGFDVFKENNDGYPGIYVGKLMVINNEELLFIDYIKKNKNYNNDGGKARVNIKK